MVEKRLYQYLTLTEPLLLNKENTAKAIGAGLLEVFGEILSSQVQNLKYLH